jgi:hypothetical protein
VNGSEVEASAEGDRVRLSQPLSLRPGDLLELAMSK